MTKDVATNSASVLDIVARCLEQGDMIGALEAAEAAVVVPDQQIDALGAIAALAYRQGNIANATRILTQIVDQPGTVSDVPEALAVLSCLSGQVTDALYYGKLATAVKPDGRLLPLFGPGFPQFSDAFLGIEDKPLFRKASAAFDAGEAAGALGFLEQHLQLFPADVEALDLYANALAHQGRYREAVGILRGVLTVGGPSATLLSRLGRCLVALGEFDLGLACHRAALLRAPKAAALWSAGLLDWEYSPWARPAERQQAVDGLLAALAAAAPKSPRKVREPKVKPVLTIGLLCGPANDEDIKQMIGRLAGTFDRATTEVVGFGPGDLDDSRNIPWRGAFDRWRNTAKVDELTLAALIRGEGVDVLIDTEGLLAGDRFGLFQRQCAPLQFTWLNVPEGVALPGAHGNLAWGGPDGTGSLPLAASLAQGGPLPAIAQGAVTFGADVILGELTSEVVRVWSSILAAVPDSKLVLFDRGLSSDEAAADRLIGLFGSFGVAHRVDVISGTAEDFFASVDVALAPFPVARPLPYGRALSQGVPVVALGGALAGSLAALGRAGEGMVAADAEDYVAKATAWAGDLDRLAKFRADMPAKLADSAPYQADAFARVWEKFFRERMAALAASPSA